MKNIEGFRLKKILGILNEKELKGSTNASCTADCGNGKSVSVTCSGVCLAVDRSGVTCTTNGTTTTTAHCS
jgi:hypothetical protein